jgi:hypothetical protein
MRVVIEGSCGHQCSDGPDVSWETGDTPTKRDVETLIRQRQLWMDAHYERTGHHRFLLTRREHDSVDVARVRQAAEAVMTFEKHDENYTTEHVGGSSE